MIWPSRFMTRSGLTSMARLTESLEVRGPVPSAATVALLLGISKTKAEIWLEEGRVVRVEDCERCGRTRKVEFLKLSGETWRCRSVSTCKQRRLEARNRAKKEKRLADADD